VGRHHQSGYERKDQTWWGITFEGEQLSFVVEAV